MTVKIPVRLGRSQPVIQVKESDTQRLILDWLAAERIWHIRLNTGAMAGSHKGKKWFVRFGRPGMADILAIVPHGENRAHSVYWIEVKGPKGQPSIDQLAFRDEVQYFGQDYILARRLEDVIEVLK